MVTTLLVCACTPAGVAPSAVPPSVAPSSAAPSSAASPSVVPPEPDPTATAAAPGPTSPVATDATSGEGTPLLPDPSADHTIGDRVVLIDFFEEEQSAITVQEAILLPESAPDDGSRYAFLVEIEALAPSIHYNPTSFTMFDDESFEYQPESGQQPELGFGDLPRGRKVRGWLTFTGPDAPGYVELQWASIEGDEPILVRALLP